MDQANWKNRTLFHGDNLEMLRGMNSESVDLIATDPPFNKGRDFHATPDSLTAGSKFQDRWSWDNDVHQSWIDQIEDDHPKLMQAIRCARETHSDSMGAFLCFLSVRLLAMHRVLKHTGSIYLHCDQTANSYIRTVLDAIFGANNFVNEIIWKRHAGGKKTSKRYAMQVDSIFVHAKNTQSMFFDIPMKDHDPEYIAKVYRNNDDDGRGPYRISDLSKPDIYGYRYDYKGYPHPANGWRCPESTMKQYDKDGLLYFPKNPTGRIGFKRFLNTTKGRPIGNLWEDIQMLQDRSPERVGYPTQKPVALYERIIKASCPDNGIVLDPFAGCATTCVAAERLGRQWVGIDLWNNASAVVARRMQNECADMFGGTITALKIPPKRTDDGLTASPFLRVKERALEPEGKQMNRHEMKEFLLKNEGPKCQGCDREFDDPRYLELDHNTPRADGGINHISNRVLLCGPCNKLKSNLYTLSGLRNRNKKNGYMRTGG